MAWGTWEMSCKDDDQPPGVWYRWQPESWTSRNGHPQALAKVTWRRGKFMTVMDYRTRDGLADYGFSIDYEPRRGWRVYIIFQPFHQGHDDNLQLPYQSIDDNGRRYVDWPDKLDSPGDARVVAALWAEVAQHYQHTQEQTAFYVKLIERHQRIQHRRRATPATPAESLIDLQESGSNTQTATNATSPSKQSQSQP